MSQQKKMKILRKYMSSANPSKVQKKGQSIVNYENMLIKDEDDIRQNSDSSQNQQSSEQVQKKRIASSDQQDDVRRESKKQKGELQKAIKEDKKDKKFKKKMRKALGIDNDEEVDQFMSNLQVEGIDKDELLKYLKKNKSLLIKKQVDDVKKQKKEKKKKNKGNKESNKFEMFEKSESSDIEIPQQARTIYRNKDGTIRNCSVKQEKEQHKKQIYDRLAEWEKGMAKPDSEPEENEDLQRAKNNKIWDDPMRRWEGPGPKKHLTCKFEGVANRFGIKPGYRWDGVIRGNNFENKYLQEINLKKAKKDKEQRQYLKDL